MLIAQISDPHITEHKAALPVEPIARLKTVVEHLNNSSTAIDLVVATGDLTNDGTTGQYELLLEILEPLSSPVALLPGNHDDHRNLRIVFEESFPNNLPTEHMSFVVEEFDLRIVCLDTADICRHDGVFDELRATWLEDTLATSTKPTMVFMHHPAMLTGIRWMDLMSLDDHESFTRIIAAHHHVHAVSAGHLHRMVSGRIAHAAATIAPSTAHQLNLDLHPDHAALVDEPPGYLLHSWNGSTVVTHTAVVGPFEVFEMNEFVDLVLKAAASPEGMRKLDH
ncbi:MAG: metallophosphoesterase [Acidimicrobiales bacterium]